MKRFKPYFKWIPEAFFTLAMIASFNPVSIGLIALLGILILIRNRMLPAILLGSTLAMLFVMGSLYMFLALLSEYSEFPTATGEAIQMLVVGTLIFGSSFVMGIVMLVKYINYSSKIQSIGDNY